MKKIFILLTSMFLLVGCIESVAVIGGGAANGKIVQTSLQSAASYGIKKKTGRTPVGHVLNYAKSKQLSEKKKSCSFFDNKKDLENCFTENKRIISNQAKIKKKKFIDKSSKEFTSSLQSSINKTFKIKYLD